MGRGRAAKKRAARAGYAAVFAQFCVAVAISLVVGFGDKDATIGLAVFCVLPMLITTPFVYTGASRMVAPHLPVSVQDFEHGYTDNNTAVTVHKGSKDVVIGRRRAVANLLVGLAIWLVSVSFGLWIAAERAG